LQQAAANQPFSQTYTLEDLIQSYSHLINDDQYIVGTDANGQPVTSEFKASPHRFVAGEAGAGKTNFLKVLLYQLLWHNPNRPIWLADFKGGMDFQVVSKIFPNVKLITDYAAFDQLLQDFWQQSEGRSTDRNENIQAELEDLLQLTPEKRKRYQEEKNQKSYKVSWERNLLIIDEMAQLAHLYDDRDQKEMAKSVKANIDKVVRLGRAFKANVVFCTQSKEENVIDSNLLNNVGDRLVFRVSADAVSLRFLGSEQASKISPRTKGRGIYRGPDYAGDAKDLREIATPRFPEDQENLVIELEVWEQLRDRQR
jgi:DNA helicase HerA-like ATPase